jgi:hypothetical protein
MHLIDDENQIAKAQKAFQDTLIISGAKQYKCKLGYKGGTVQADVFWLESVGIWVAFQKIENRYWNAFGVKEPVDGENLDITCEINSPLIGINRMISGAFAMDDKGEMYILHSGKIGGGRKGIGKTLFRSNYKYGLIKLDDGLEYAQIGKLGDASLPNKTANFVREIDRIKKLAKGDSDSSKSGFVIAEVEYAHPTKDFIEKSLKELGKTKASKQELLMKLKEIIGRDGGLLVDDETAWNEILKLSDEYNEQ